MKSLTKTIVILSLLLINNNTCHVIKHDNNIELKDGTDYILPKKYVKLLTSGNKLEYSLKPDYKILEYSYPNILDTILLENNKLKLVYTNIGTIEKELGCFTGDVMVRAENVEQLITKLITLFKK